MKKCTLAIAACALFLGACKKEPPMQEQPEYPASPATAIENIRIVNGMLSFSSAGFYDAFVGQPEEKALHVLWAYEKSAAFESLAESRHFAEDETYTPLISALLNRNLMIHIENKVYRINAKSGYVYSIPSGYINDPRAIDALINEKTSDRLIEVNSVEEDLWEISGLPVPKATPGGGCPTIPVNQILDKGDFTSPYSTLPNCPNPSSPSEFRLWTYLRYYRYGVLFELSGRGRETNSATLGSTPDVTCNTIMLDSPVCTFRRNHSSFVYDLPHQSTSGNGEAKYKPYSGGNRLCWFHWAAKTSRSAVGRETALVELNHNYTP